MKSNYDYYQNKYEKYDLDYEIHKLSKKSQKKKQSLFSKIYGYLLLIVFAISLSMLDSVSFVPTIILTATIILGTIYLYLGGHLDGN